MSLNKLFIRLFRNYPTDGLAKKYPVSVKGVILLDGKVVLLKNRRNEWELPGGKLDPGESPEACVVREIQEELGLKVAVSRILDSWVYNILGKVEVLIITYYCTCIPGESGPPRISHEHKELGLFSPEDVPGLNMPEGYKRSINAVLSSIDA